MGSALYIVLEKKIFGLDAAVDSQGRIYVLDLATKDVRLMARKPSPSA